MSYSGGGTLSAKADGVDRLQAGGGGTLSAKADGVDRLQAGDMVEAEDLDIQISQTCNRSATIRGGTRADHLG